MVCEYNAVFLETILIQLVYYACGSILILVATVFLLFLSAHTSIQIQLVCTSKLFYTKAAVCEGHFLRAICSTKVATNCKYVAGVTCCNNYTNISLDVRRICNYFLCTYVVFDKLMYFVCSSLIRFLQSNIFLTYCSGSDIVFCNFPKTFLVKIHPKYG